MPSVMYDPHRYWEARLQANFGLDGVGFQKRGLTLNKWMYEGKLFALEQALATQGIDLQNKSICDVGCGTGFYSPFWLSHSPCKLVGWDITSISVTHLQRNYPQARFEQRDISQPLVNYDGSMFDLVTAIDVLFHVTEPTAFRQSLINLGTITKPGGHVLITDYCWQHGTIKTKPHARYHSWAEYVDGLEQAELAINGVYPQTFLMNAPIDLPNPVMRYVIFLVWTLVSYVGCIEPLGNWVGRHAYEKDTSLIRQRRQSSSTKILICRKRDTG